MSPADLIVKLLSDGGVLGALIAIVILLSLPGWLAFYWERKRHDRTTDKLIELSTASIETSLKNAEAIRGNTRVMEKALEQRP